MRLFYLLFMFLLCQCTTIQKLQLDLIYEVIHKAEKNEKLTHSEVSLLMNSYNVSSLRNNVEFSECRSGSVIQIMCNIDNTRKLLDIIKHDKNYQDVLIEELHSPIFELNKNKIIGNLKNIKGYGDLKNEIISILEEL